MKTVLIVDDSEVDTFIHKRILEQLKPVKEIHTAANGNDAIKLLNEYFQNIRPLPDIILLDLNMPIMDGFGFIKAFKDLPLAGKENVTIVVVTSSTSPSDISKATEAGITNFIVKPLSEEKIISALGV